MKSSSRERVYGAFFESLANPLRMKIVLLAFNKPMSVGQISEELGEEQSKISHSLQILRLCGIMSMKKEGREHLYISNSKLLSPLFAFVDSHACKGCKGCPQLARKEKTNKAR